MNYKLLLIFSLFLFCVSCSDDEPNSQYEPIILNADEELAAINMQEFSLEFFKDAYIHDTRNKERHPSDDSQAWGTLVSPISGMMATSLFTKALSEDDQTKFRNWLHISEAEDGFNGLMNKLLVKLPKADKKCTMNLANSIWCPTDCDIAVSYEKQIKESFFAGIRRVDMTSPSLVTQVNDWCSRATFGKIEHFIEKPMADSSVLFLNAIFFDGKWTQNFDEKFTEEASFKDYFGQIQRIRMMSAAKNLVYGKSDTFEYAKMSYGNGAFSFTGILPNEECTIDEVVSSLTPQIIKSIIDKDNSCYYLISLPKFEMKVNNDITSILADANVIEPGRTYNLQAFGFENWNLGNFIQIIKIENSERGTTVAAASGNSGDLAIEPVGDITFDRPFIYLINEKSTGTIIAAGTIMGF